MAKRGQKRAHRAADEERRDEEQQDEQRRVGHGGPAPFENALRDELG